MLRRSSAIFDALGRYHFGLPPGVQVLGMKDKLEIEHRQSARYQNRGLYVFTRVILHACALALERHHRP
jgi:hypothetical protein